MKPHWCTFPIFFCQLADSIQLNRRGSARIGIIDIWEFEWPCFAQKFRYGLKIFFYFCLVLLAVGPFSFLFFFGCSWALPAQVQARVSVQLQQLRSSASMQISETGFCVWHCVDKPDSTDSNKGCSA